MDINFKPTYLSTYIASKSILPKYFLTYNEIINPYKTNGLPEQKYFMLNNVPLRIYPNTIIKLAPIVEDPIIPLVSSTSQYITFPVSLLAGLNTFTIELTFSTTTLGANDYLPRTPMLLGFDRMGADSHDLGIHIQNGKITILAGILPVDTTISTTKIINDGIKHKLVIISTGSSISVYIDGNKEAEKIGSVYTLSDTDCFVMSEDNTSVGNDHYQYAIDFTLYDLKFWTISKSIDEIKDTVETNSSGLRGWYKGNIDSVDSSILIDSSINKLNGTIHTITS
jgi:hypothetical protein